MEDGWSSAGGRRAKNNKICFFFLSSFASRHFTLSAGFLARAVELGFCALVASFFASALAVGCLASRHRASPRDTLKLPFPCSRQPALAISVGSLGTNPSSLAVRNRMQPPDTLARRRLPPAVCRPRRAWRGDSFAGQTLSACHTLCDPGPATCRRPRASTDRRGGLIDVVDVRERRSAHRLCPTRRVRRYWWISTAPSAWGGKVRHCVFFFCRCPVLSLRRRPLPRLPRGHSPWYFLVVLMGEVQGRLCSLSATRLSTRPRTCPALVVMHLSSTRGAGGREREDAAVGRGREGGRSGRHSCWL